MNDNPENIAELQAELAKALGLLKRILALSRFQFYAPQDLVIAVRDFVSDFKWPTN